METREKIKYCTWSNGILYFCVRTADGGKSYAPLPTPDHPDFAIAYSALKDAHEAKKKARKADVHDTSANRRQGNYITNSMKALIFEAERTRDYRALANSTRVEVDRYYRMFLNEFGDRLVADISAAEIDRRMDQTDMLENPGKALNYLKHLKNLFELGIRRDYRKDKHNPAAGAPVPECGERLPWPDDVYEGVMSRATPMLRMAVLLGVYTGQRISDCIKIDRDLLLQCADIGEPMMLEQQKTGVTVYIPIHPDLAKEVRAMEPSDRSTTVLYNRYGLAFPKPDQIQDRLKKLMIELGYTRNVTKSGVQKLETLYKFHGLRKLSSCHLAEVGATPHEISAMNGMDINTVIHYTRGVAKKKLSRGFTDRMSTIRPGHERPDLRLSA